MKMPLISNFRPLLRAFYAFLIVTAVLWALPRSAHAQLYVTQLVSPNQPPSIVGEYHATTGKVINANFITGVNWAGAIALSSDKHKLFVLNQAPFNTVGKYDATTGAAINVSFIAGLTFPAGLAVLDNTLFVSNFFGTVGEYDATTGVAINANFITGLDAPQGLAVGSLSFGGAT